jgi:hypothetical protein
MKAILFSLGLVLASITSPAIAGTTPVDLYRSGNTTSPRMDNVRVQDITQVTINNVVYVKSASGGISTSTTTTNLSTTVWKIPKGTSFPDTIKLNNDSPGHYAWEPAAQMKLADFTSLMTGLNAKFVKNEVTK